MTTKITTTPSPLEVVDKINAIIDDVELIDLSAYVDLSSQQETQLTMTKARTNCHSEKFLLNFPEGMPCRGYKKMGEEDDGRELFEPTKSIFLFSPEQIIAWDEDFSLFLASCKGDGWLKQAEVEACTTIEELEAIVLS